MDWLCGDKNFINKAMLGNEYTLLGLGIDCNDDVINYDDIIPYHAAIYGSNKVELNLRIYLDHHVKIYIYDILGRNHGLILTI